MTLTVAEAAQHVERLSYMPGWSFSLIHDMHTGDVRMQVRAMVADSVNPDKEWKIQIGGMYWGSSYVLEDIDTLERWVGHNLRQAILHEHDEWFKRDGKPINDPHHQPERIP